MSIRYASLLTFKHNYDTLHYMNNSEQAPSSPEVQISAQDLRRLFGPEGNLESIEALRDSQRAAYADAVEANHDHSPEVSEFYATQAVNATVTDYLQDNGVSKTDPKYNMLKDGLINLSVLGVPDSDWAATLDKDDPTKTGYSGRDKARALFEQVSGESYYARNDNEVNPDQEIIDEWRAELNDLRETLAVLSAKRQGHVLGDGGQKYAEAKRAYDDQMIALAKLENESVINSTELSDDDKKVKVTEYLFAEQAKLRESTTEKLKGTKVGKFVEWMNRGRVATRVAKGLLIGVGVGLAGAGIGALAGVAGVATIGGGVAAVGTATVRFARGFASKDARANRGIAVLDQDVHKPDYNACSSTDYIDTAHQHFDNLFEQDTKLEQKKRRSSVKWGIGAMAVGVVLAEAGQLAIDTHWFDGLMNHHDPLTGHINNHSNIEQTHSNVVNGRAPDLPPAGTSADNPGYIPQPNLPGPGPEFSVDAHTVTPGEGWYQTFKDMGIKSDEWSSLLKKVGPVLHEKGWAYNMHGSWGISHPGQLPDDVLELIKNSR